MEMDLEIRYTHDDMSRTITKIDVLFRYKDNE